MKTKIEFRGVSKSYGEVQVLHDLNFSIEENEFFVLFGPAGAGKTTIMKLIAGLEFVSSGTILIDGKDATAIAPEKRKIRMAFENFTLYPHLTVFENLASPLRNNKYSKQEIKNRVQKTAQMLEIDPYLNRLPKQLSGGQKQRVSLGRALVMESGVYLLDEPLAHLDAKLRSELRSEFQNLKTSLRNSTVVYVTHDYTEAMSLGDRVCVIEDKKIVQIDTPQSIYNNPRNVSVARMFGQPEINILPVETDLHKKTVFNQLFEIPLAGTPLEAHLDLYGKPSVIFGCRPRDWEFSLEHGYFQDGFVQGEVVGFEIKNFRGIILSRLENGQYISVSCDEYSPVAPGSRIYLKPNPAAGYLFDADTEQNVSLGREM